MRFRDPGEQFRDGLEQGTTLWWGEVVDVLELQDIETTDPITGEPLTINVVPPRSLVVRSLNGYGGAVAVPFIEPAGETSVPPKGSRVLVCSDGQGGHIVLGFYTPQYPSKQRSGEFGQMTPGERTIYGRGYRLRILDNYFDAADVRPAEAELDVDLIIGRRDQTIAPPSLESDATTLAERAWNSLRTFWADVITKVLNDFASELGQDRVIILEERLSAFLIQVVRPEFADAVTRYLEDEGQESFLSILSKFVATGAFGEIQEEAITRGYNGYILPVIRDLLSRELAGHIHGWQDVEETVKRTLVNELLRRNEEIVEAYRNIYAGHIISYTLSKVRNYIVSKVEESLAEAEDRATQQALKALRNEWLKSATSKVKQWLRQGLLWEDEHLVNVRKAQKTKEILNKIASEINEGLVDPEAFPVFDLTVRSRRSGATSFNQERKVRCQVLDDGSIEVSCDDTHRITLRPDGAAILDVSDLLVTADNIQVAADVLGLSSGPTSANLEKLHEKVDDEVQVDIGENWSVEVGGKATLDCQDIRLGGESGTRAVVLDNDRVIISSSFLSWLVSHVHNAGGAPTSPPVTPLTASASIGNVKASARRTKAK